MNQFKTIFQDFKKCLKVALLPIISILIYMGLKSTSILEGGMHQFNGAYHPAYLGWYDFVLGYTIIFSFVTGSLKLQIKDFFPGLVGFFIIFASWINSYQADKMFIVAGLVCFLRFFLVFIFAKALVHKLGYQTAESVLLSVYAVIAASAVLWYSLQFGAVQNRMAASAMTSASFGQVSGIMCLVFYARKYYLALFFSFIFLFLSFSRTSLLLFLLLIVVQNRQIIPLNLIKYVVVFLILAMVGTAALQQYGGKETQVVLKSRFSTEEVSNLNGRSDIWTNAMQLVKDGQVPLTGVGFHMTPSLIKVNNFKLFSSDDTGGYSPLPHFHSIVIEYFLSLGIFAFVIFFYLIKRIWQTFQHNCSPAFFIFAFFTSTQTIDYTFYPPKEIIIFALMLGLAEGQLSSTISTIKSIERKSPSLEKQLH